MSEAPKDGPARRRRALCPCNEGATVIVAAAAASGANPAIITARGAGTTSDPLHVVKRKAVGSLSFEGITILEDGTMDYGDGNRPLDGKPGGGIYKFVPDHPYNPSGGPSFTDQAAR